MTSYFPKMAQTLAYYIAPQKIRITKKPAIIIYNFLFLSEYQNRI